MNVCVGAFSFFVCVEDLHTIGEIAWLAAAGKKGIRVGSFMHMTVRGAGPLLSPNTFFALYFYYLSYR